MPRHGISMRRRRTGGTLTRRPQEVSGKISIRTRSLWLLLRCVRTACDEHQPEAYLTGTAAFKGVIA